MKYSCFDQRAGHYRVFEGGDYLPVNGDLPVVQLPSDVNGVGVPAMDALRPFPRGVREVGTSWRAQGVVVRCPEQRPFAGFGADESGGSQASGTFKVVVGAGMIILGFILASKMVRG